MPNKHWQTFANFFSQQLILALRQIHSEWSLRSGAIKSLQNERTQLDEVIERIPFKPQTMWENPGNIAFVLGNVLYSNYCCLLIDHAFGNLHFRPFGSLINFRKVCIQTQSAVTEYATS